MPIGVSGYNELIESFAASIGLDGVETEGGAAAFEIDGMKVDIFHDDSADTVMIYGEIGQPPSEDDRSFGPAMLKANHLFGGTGGATLSQDPETGEYAIFQAFPLAGLDAESLAAQLREHSVTREYTALVYDNIREDELTIDEPIGRDERNRMRNAVNGSAARNAVTHIKVLERFGKYTLVRAKLETGRTHQIRVHMAYIHHPLAGDELYGPRRQSSKIEGIEVRGQLLHAGTLGFIHPSTGEYLEFHSELPEVFENVLAKLRQ